MVPESQGFPCSMRSRVADDVPISFATSRMVRSSMVRHLRKTVPNLMVRTVSQAYRSVNKIIFVLCVAQRINLY
jgi:hypothetical protein